MKDIDKYEDSGMCACGHPKDKHRDRRGKTSCRKCGCKKYTPTYVDENQKHRPIPHEPGCRCADCAWERLENAERNLLIHKGQIAKLNLGIVRLEYFIATTFNITPEDLAELEAIREKEHAEELQKSIDERNASVQPTEQPPQTEG